MSIIESVRAFVLTYPHLPAGNVLIDYLGSSACEFTLEPVPCNTIYRQYTDGGALKQYLFLLASRFFYADDVRQCADNQKFFEDFAVWVRAQDKAGNLPVLADGRTAVSLEVLTHGYVISEDTGTARYQIQLRLIYEEE